MKKIITVLIILGVVFGLGYLLHPTHSSSNNTKTIDVTASFYPLAEFAHQVGRELISVHTLTPVGAEPHDFEPSPQDLATLHNSQLLIYNGAGLEPWVSHLDTDMEHKAVVVNLSQTLPVLRTTKNEVESQSETQTTQPDPHFWLDPVLASQEVEHIKNGLITVDPAHKETYELHAQEYQQQLAELDQEFRLGLANCTHRTIVASHNAFQYLAKNYNLQVLSLSGFSPDEEPSAKKLAEVAEFVKQNQIKYIFSETLISPKLAETIAQETGVQTIVFNPLEGLTPDELAAGKNYISIQKDNLKALRLALECK